VATGSVYVHADVTAVFPWVTYCLLSDPKVRRRPLRLLDARGEAVDGLRREVEKRRNELLTTIAYPLVDEEPRHASVRGRRRKP
jgi:deoxyhypusine synthase